MKARSPLRYVIATLLVLVVISVFHRKPSVSGTPFTGSHVRVLICSGKDLLADSGSTYPDQLSTATFTGYDGSTQSCYVLAPNRSGSFKPVILFPGLGGEYLFFPPLGLRHLFRAGICHEEGNGGYK